MSKKGSFAIQQDDYPIDQMIHLFSLEHDHENVVQLTRTYCLESSSLEIQKKGMEFLYINGLFDDLQLLITKNKNSKHPSNEQWAQVYQLMIDHRTRRYPNPVLMDYIENFDTDEPELKCLLEFINVGIFLKMKDYRNVGNLLDRIECLLDEIADPFLTMFLTKRLNQTYFLYYWMRNEIIIARKFAYQVLNQTINMQTKINIHMNLGLSYTFDTYFQGMYHLKEAYRLAKKCHNPYYIYILKNYNIPFLSAHFKKVDGIHTVDKSEQAHIEIAKGNNEAAISILNELPLDTPFQLYYMGLAKQDKHILLQSYESFIKDQSDYFFGRLPLNVLRDMDGF